MIRLWSAEAPFACPNSNRSSPRTRAPGRVDAQYAAPESERAEPDDDDVPFATGRVVSADGRWFGHDSRRAHDRVLSCAHERAHELDVATGARRGHRRGRRTPRTESLRRGTPSSGRSVATVGMRPPRRQPAHGRTTRCSRPMSRSSSSSARVGAIRVDPWAEVSGTMRYVLDSSFCIDHFRGLPDASRRLDSLYADGDDPIVTSVTVCEVWSGRRRAGDPSIADFFRYLEYVHAGPTAARLAGEWRAQARESGRMLDVPDALIAACAFELDAAVLTRNVRDFELTPVRVETY